MNGSRIVREATRHQLAAALLRWGFPMASVVVAVAGCLGGSGGDKCEEGDEGCACFGNDTCNDGLDCRSQLCVDVDRGAGSSDRDAGGQDEGPEPDGGKPSQDGEANTQGDAGEHDAGGADSDAQLEPEGSNADAPRDPVDAGSSGAPQAESSSEDSGAETAPSEPEEPVADDAAPPAASSDTSTDMPMVIEPAPESSGWRNCPNNPAGCEVDTTTRCDVEATALWIDDFATCDVSICSIAGRVGKWFSFAGDGIGLDSDQRGVMVPPNEWSDPNCGMLLAGGGKAEGGEYYAGVGFALNDGYAYDISAYNGVHFALGTGNSLHFTLRNSADEYFVYPSTVGGTDSVAEFYVPLAQLEPRSDNPSAVLDLQDVVEFQWTVDSPEDGFGFVLHGVWFD